MEYDLCNRIVGLDFRSSMMEGRATSWKVQASGELSHRHTWKL